MKAVGGWVTSSEPTSLKAASRILARFTARDNETSQAVSSYLKRASASFNELLQLHRELQKSQKSGKRKHEERRKRKREERDDGGEEDSEKKLTKKKKKKRRNEEEEA